MTRTPHDHELDQLLAQGRLAGPQKDRIFADVLAVVARPRAAWIRRVTGSRWALGVAAATVVLVALPLVLWRSESQAPKSGELRAKGPAGSGPTIEASCAEACRHGATLLFRVDGLERPAYLAAYAIGPSGERVWYFPTLDGAMPHVTPTDAPRHLEDGVRLGVEHAVGRHEIHLLLVEAPRSRDEVAKLERSDVVVHVVQSLEVMP